MPDILVANTNTTDLGFLEPNLIDDVTVNCDMLTNAADGTPIKAIAWDERGRSIRTHLYFEDGQGNVAIQNIDNPIIGKRPDIVLGDDIRFPGVNYRAAVIYVAADDRVKIRFYTLTNIGTPGFTATADALEITLGSNKQLYAHDTDPQPHIDMWSDANNRITDYIGNNLHGMWEWVATWSEPNGGVSYYNNVWYAHGHINNSIITIPASLSGTIATVHKDRCKMSDVACYTDITTGQKIAAFVYCTPYDPNYMVVTELDMTTSGSHFVSAMTVLNSAWAFFPRIESMSQYHPWIEPAKWQVVVSASVGSPFNPQIPWLQYPYRFGGHLISTCRF